MTRVIELGDVLDLRAVQFAVQLAGTQFVLRVAHAVVYVRGIASNPTDVEIDVTLMASEPD